MASNKIIVDGVISIHALREEGDSSKTVTSKVSTKFLSTPSARRATHQQLRQHHQELISIHALREEGDRHWSCKWTSGKQFLSTPSARRATIAYLSPSTFFIFLSTPSARRATFFLLLTRYPPQISIHALREEGDTRACGKTTRACDFYPRPPRGGRQQKQRQNLYFQTNYTTFCTNLEEL